MEGCFVRTYHTGSINPIKSLPSGRHLQLLASRCLTTFLLGEGSVGRRKLQEACRWESVWEEIKDCSPFYVVYSNRQLCVCPEVILTFGTQSVNLAASWYWGVPLSFPWRPSALKSLAEVLRKQSFRAELQWRITGTREMYADVPSFVSGMSPLSSLWTCLLAGWTSQWLLETRGKHAGKQMIPNPQSYPQSPASFQVSSL